MKCSKCGYENEEDDKYCSNCGAKFNEETKKHRVLFIRMTLIFVLIPCVLLVTIFSVSNFHIKKVENSMKSAIESKSKEQVMLILDEYADHYLSDNMTSNEREEYYAVLKVINEYLTQIYYDIANNSDIKTFDDAVKYLSDNCGTILIDEDYNIPLQKCGDYYVEIFEEDFLIRNWDFVDETPINEYAVKLKIGDVFSMLKSKISYQDAIKYYAELEELDQEGYFSSITYSCVELNIIQVKEDDCNYEAAQKLMSDLENKYGEYYYESLN